MIIAGTVPGRDRSRHVGRTRAEAKRQVEPLSQDSNDTAAPGPAQWRRHRWLRTRSSTSSPASRSSSRATRKSGSGSRGPCSTSTGSAVRTWRRDFPIQVTADGQRRATKKADIAIFEHDAPHTLENLRRVVICKPEPKNGRAVTKIRTFEQAQKDLDELQDAAGHGGDPAGRVRHVDQRDRLLLPAQGDRPVQRQLRAPRRLAACGRVRPGRDGRVRGAAAPRRGRDAQDGVPPLPQLHPRQRGHAEGRGVLAVPVPAVRQDARRAGEPAHSAARQSSTRCPPSRSTKKAGRRSASGSRLCSPR